MKHLLLILSLWLGLIYSAWGQTSLFAEDFENGTLGSFTAVNGQQVPAWYAGTAPGNGPSWAGSTAAFVSTNAGTYGPLSSLSGVVHLYRDISFPATATGFTLRFDFISEGSLDVFLAPISYQPTAGIRPTAATANLIAGNVKNGPSFTSVSLRLPASAASTTQRLIFTWTSASQAPAALPAALDNVSITADVTGPMAGAYTIDRQQARSARNFQSLSEAVRLLNTVGTSAPVVLAIPAGQRFVELVPQVWGTNSHPVLFQKQGLGANPQLQGGAIDLVGAHDLTFDGLDIVPGSGTIGPEAGYAVSGAYNQGSHDIIIRNATITMRQDQDETKGIYQRNMLLASGGPGDTVLVNRRIRYENLQIRQACHGIWMLAGTGVTPDFDVEVAHVTIGDGTPGNIGYPTKGYAAYGMYFMRVNGLNVHDNLVQGVVSRTDYAVGIFVYDLMGPLPAVFANNRIRDIEFRHPANPAMFAQPALVVGLWLLQAATNLPFAAGHSVQVTNNEIGGLRQGLAPGAAIPTNRNGQTIGVLAELGGFPKSSMLFAHNTVAVAAPAWPSFSSYTLSLGTKKLAYGTAELVNNILLNTTPPINAAPYTTAQSVVNVGIPATQTTPPFARVRMDYNDIVLAAGTERFFGSYGVGTSGGSQQYASLAAWQAATGFDAHSTSLDPMFNAGPGLRPTNAALDDTGTPLAAVPTDLEGVTRGRIPDVGAYEFGRIITGTSVAHGPEPAQAWPVPFANELHVALPMGTTGPLQLELLDVLGRVVRQQAASGVAATVLLTGLQALPAGTYWLHLRTSQAMQVRRLTH